VALLAIGECARRLSGGGGAAVSDGVEAVVLVALESRHDEVRAAAAVALGCIAAGRSRGLPSLLKLVADRPKQKYMLLSALKKALACLVDAKAASCAADSNVGGGAHEGMNPTPTKKQRSRGGAAAELSAHAMAVEKVLVDNADAKEEGVRSLVAECYGALLAGAPRVILPRVKPLISKGACTRKMLLDALRHTLLRTAPGQARWRGERGVVDEGVRGGLTHEEETWRRCVTKLVKEALNSSEGVLELFKDTDLAVRRQAMVLLYTAMPYHPGLFNDSALTGVVVPEIYAAVTRDPKLVRTVNFGPFKHTVDDGLPLRRAGFRALGVVIASTKGHASRQLVTSPQSLEKLAGGLADNEADVALLAWRVLQDVARSRAAQALLEIVDALPPRILSSIKKLLRAAKGTDAVAAERARDVLKECVRGLHAVMLVPGVERCTEFIQFFERVKQTTLLNQMLKDIVRGDQGGAVRGSSR